MNKAPKFWNDQTILSSALSTALLPLSWIWRGATAARLAWIKPEEEGAFFIDAGNIWNVNNNVPDSSQSLNSYRDLNQLAVGTGFGLRYDFDYFIFRLDTAFKTFDPSQAPQDRWGSQIALDKAVFNVGINYPF